MFKHVAAFTLITLLTGCAAYTPPGRRADFAALGISPEDQRAGAPSSINAAFDKKPLASFPATVAVVRIQQSGYRSPTSESYGQGAYSVVTTRDVESQASVERIRKLPNLRGLAPLNRILLPDHLETDRELRNAAAQLQCDMLLIYTFDTAFHDHDLAAPLSVITLGLSPTQATNVVTTASAVLMDTRNGFIYGVAEASEKRNGLATAWNTTSALDEARKKTESAAFEKLVAEVETVWKTVLQDYGRSAPKHEETPRQSS
jgi:hypothetical protein